MNEIYYGSKKYSNVNPTEIYTDLFNYFNFTNYEIKGSLFYYYLTSGYVPAVNFREALRLIAEATCCYIKKTRNGGIEIISKEDQNRNNICKKFTRKLLFKESNEQKAYNNSIDVVEYRYAGVSKEIYKENLTKGTHKIFFEEYPIENLSKNVENNNYEIVESTAFYCVVNVINTTVVHLKALVYTPIKTVVRINKNENIEIKEENIEKIDNPLINSGNSKRVGDWKLEKKQIKYNFDTLTIPYIENGDVCYYSTEFGENKKIVPTKIEYNKTIIQSIEGE